MENHTSSSPANPGIVVSVRGSVVEVRFEGRLPPIHTVLHAGKDGCIVIEVLAQRDARHVRGIALTPTQGLARGMVVRDTALGPRAPEAVPRGRGQDRPAHRDDPQHARPSRGREHLLRQSGIDAELFDVIAGFEALGRQGKTK